jgi:hypothetical protein
MTWLLEDISADANGTGVNADGGGKTVSIWATNFGGGTVTIQGSPDGGTTWITLTEGGVAVAFIANAVRYIDRLGIGMQIRATLVGSAGADSVNVKLFQ